MSAVSVGSRSKSSDSGSTGSSLQPTAEMPRKATPLKIPKPLRKDRLFKSLVSISFSCNYLSRFF